ncbi:MAG: hypothetical protein ACXW4B_10470 [Micavibrio sp.]
MNDRSLIRGFFLALTSIIHISAAQAAVTEIQALDFGEWVVAGNDAVDNITVQTDGSFASSPGLIMLSPPQEGIFLFDGLPPSSVINSVDVTMTQPMTMGGGEVFTLDNFTTIAPDTDPAGETTITLGARARTSGNSNPYGNGLFTGQLEIDINF